MNAMCAAAVGFRRPLSSSAASTLQPPNVSRLAKAARITLSPHEVEAFEPKMRQVVHWFGQLQAVDLENIEPSLRADAEIGGEPRSDLPEVFENREALIEAVPCFKDQFLKVPKVLTTE